MTLHKADKFTHLGYVLNILAQNKEQCYRTAADIRELAENAIAHDQIEFYFQQTFPVGYVAWAYLSEEVIGRMLYYHHKLHFSEWYEGKYLWIMDICFIDKRHENLWFDFLCRIFAKYKYIYWSDNTFNSNRIYKINIKSRRISYIETAKFMEILGRKE